MREIRKVHVVYKTHLDIGFTDLSENVINNYLDEFIPKAINLANEVNSKESKKFIWTVGSWLIYKYLKVKSGEDREKLVKAINDGYIVWHALPFTTHTELMNKELLQCGINISKELDKEFNQQKIAAKMTDVPGHTRGMIKYLAESGIKYLHIGVNDVSHMPDVPGTFIWKDSLGNEILVDYCQGYGKENEIEELDELLVFAHTGDNLGPPSKQDIIDGIEKLKKEYPNAIVEASTLDEYAKVLLKVKSNLPVVEQEIGDTWIHGVGSDPIKVQIFKELLRLAEKWSNEGKITVVEKQEFLRELLLIPEHTWGLDHKKYLCDYKNWNKKDFVKARKNDFLLDEYITEEFKDYGDFARNEFKKQIRNIEWEDRTYSRFESSHTEQRGYLYNAINKLSNDLKDEALTVIGSLTDIKEENISSYIKLDSREFSKDGRVIRILDDGSICITDNKNSYNLGQVSYEEYGRNHFSKWEKEYCVCMEENYLWAIPDQFKLGINNCRIPEDNVLYFCELQEAYMNDESLLLKMKFSEKVIEELGAPRIVEVKYSFKGNEILQEVKLIDKDANRLPESLWISNLVDSDIKEITLNKLGEEIDYRDVVKFGNRNYHCVESIIANNKDYKVKITPLDSPLVSLGERRLYDFTQQFANASGGIHTNLYNNLWGTNFKMWYEENIYSRIHIDLPIER